MLCCQLQGYVQPVTQQYELKSTSVMKIAIMKNTNNFCYAKEASKDEWNTKLNTGKSMKNALYVLQYTK